MCCTEQERLGIAIFEMCGKVKDERCFKCPYRLNALGKRKGKIDGN